MKLSNQIIQRLKTDLKFKNGLQSALNIPESTLRYRIKNNTMLDSFEAVEYYKTCGFEVSEMFNTPDSGVKK